MDRALKSLPHCIDGKETENVLPYKFNEKLFTLLVLDLPPRTTKESLKEIYSRFGSVSDCWVKQGTTGTDRVGGVTFASQISLDRAWDAQPHVIDGSRVFLQYATHDLDLQIKDVPEGITEHALRQFYSKYGQLRRCRLFKGENGRLQAAVSYSAIDEVNRAMEDRPHVFQKKALQISALGKGHNSNRIFSSHVLFVGSLPEEVTEETLLDKFSKYGKPVFWELKNDGRFGQTGPYGFVAYGTVQEARQALKNQPHKIEGSVVDVRKAKNILEISDIPEDVTNEDLIAFYSKYGRVEDCRLVGPRRGEEETGKTDAFVIFSEIDEALDALNSGPHTIKGLVADVRKAKEANESLSKERSND
ncbi:RNA recognition motif domain-containing protein [Ditylenchus destructor]|nr:RNA recognition motif domain-containing protein [Ditylenchus destructor]